MLNAIEPSIVLNLSRKQMQAETIEQFLSYTKGLVAECDFGTQTESLVNDVFILNVINLAVQERL